MRLWEWKRDSRFWHQDCIKFDNLFGFCSIDNRYFGSDLDYMDSTDVFLDKLGMKNYLELFEKNGICKINELLSVKNSTLKNMGVRSSKDRRKILGAINSLRASSRPAYLKQHSLIQPPPCAASKTIGTTLSRLV